VLLRTTSTRLCSTRNSPALVLVKLCADNVENWHTPGVGVASLVSFVKARVTDER